MIPHLNLNKAGSRLQKKNRRIIIILHIVILLNYLCLFHSKYIPLLTLK
jgi:hypothetical protein